MSVLALSGSLVRGLTADGVVVKNSVFLDRGFASFGQVRLLERADRDALA